MLDAILDKLEQQRQKSMGRKPQTEDPREAYKAGIKAFEDAQLLGERASYEKAKDYFTRVITLTPTDSDAWGMYGATLWRLGNNREALHVFIVESLLRPSSVVCRDIASVLESLGRLEEAFKFAQKNAELNPIEDAWLYLRKLAIKVGNDDAKNKAELNIKRLQPLRYDEIIRRGWHAPVYEGPHFERNYSKHVSIETENRTASREMVHS